MTRHSRSAALITGLLIATLPAVALAQSKPPDLGQATIEQLLNLEVTSAGRRQQRAEDVAAAVYVISREDIRRSGLTLLPEILRLAPGVQVAQVNANKWAVSVRGFNSLYSNKLLILLDGRSVYNHAFAGVYWDALDLDIEEIERIEIVRGPGGAMWGSNAVNGVINIITRSAHASKGGSASVALGTFEQGRANVRYGGSVGRASYRLFGQWSGYGGGVASGAEVDGERWEAATGSYRLDWANETDTVMARGHYTTGRNPTGLFNPTVGPRPASGVTNTDEISALGRWTRTLGNGSVFQAQAYTVRRTRDESPLKTVESSNDVDLQYETTLPRQSLVLGGGYRHVDLGTVGTATLQIAPERSHIVSAFLQDEFTIVRRLKLTVGSRIEYEDLHGWAWSPSGRLIWEASPRQRLWAAASRALRTPAASDRSLRINVASIPTAGLPILIGVVGNPLYGTETLTQAEAGYRIRVGSEASIDLTAFRGHYDGLPTYEPLAPVFEATPGAPHLFVATQLTNLMEATTSGLELAGHWSPLPAWSLDASYSALRITPIVNAISQDASAGLFDGSAPRHQWHVRSTTMIGARTNMQAALYRVGALRQSQIPAYTRLDAHIEFALRSGLAAVVSGRNLLESSHVEFSGRASAVTGSAVPRSARVELRWQFR